MNLDRDKTPGHGIERHGGDRRIADEIIGHGNKALRFGTELVNDGRCDQKADTKADKAG